MAPWYSQHGTDVRHRGEADLDVSAVGADVHLVWKCGAVFLQSGVATRVCAKRDPFLSFEEDVVIGDGEEMVAVRFIPCCNHLREIVAIAPEAVGMEVAFPPVAGLGGDGRNSKEQRGESE